MDEHIRVSTYGLLNLDVFLFQLIVTAGEDCTCRIWGMDGTQLEVIKEHT